MPVCGSTRAACGTTLTRPADWWSPNAWPPQTLDYWDIGTWRFRLTAIDPLGHRTSDEFTIEVGPAGINHAPVIAQRVKVPGQPGVYEEQAWNDLTAPRFRVPPSAQPRVR